MKRALARPTAVFSGAFLIVLSLSGALLISLADAHKEIGAHAFDDADGLELMVQREASRNVDQLDLSIQAIVDGVEQPNVKRLTMTLRDQMLFSRAAAGRYIRNVLVFRPDGSRQMHMIKEGQMKDNGVTRTAADQFYSLVA